jgi:hypothetical protein
MLCDTFVTSIITISRATYLVGHEANSRGLNPIQSGTVSHHQLRDFKNTTLIFIAQENHSFDNYFATYPGVNGLTLDTAIPFDPNQTCLGYVHPLHLNVTQPIIIWGDGLPPGVADPNDLQSANSSAPYHCDVSYLVNQVMESQFCQSSAIIITLTEDNFNLPLLGSRVVSANNMMNSFDFTRSPQQPLIEPADLGVGPTSILTTEVVQQVATALSRRHHPFWLSVCLVFQWN